jgi:6-pyruvoyltetrahydropterin/6-carboxytetrahydropterin synthase
MEDASCEASVLTPDGLQSIAIRRLLRVRVDQWETMPFLISTRMTFHAGHQLRLYDGSWEELHEHDWRVKVTVAADALDSIGVVMDFHELERLIEAIVAPWRGRRLNDLPEFAERNPSAEYVALHIGRRLELPVTVKLFSVEVWETPENSAIYRP